jgi:hypothetical protein
VIAGEHLDFRDEILAQIHDHGRLAFRIETSDQGVTRGTALRQRREISGWRQIGTITFDVAVVSYNADHVINFNHPPWRQPR